MQNFQTRRSKGQSIVEFALVLPLFMLFLTGIFQFGLMFYDYSTLQNVARSSCRSASLGTSVAKITKSYADDPPTLRAYTWDPSNTSELKITVPTKKDKNGNYVPSDVTVDIHAKLQPFSFVNYVANYAGLSPDKLAINITYKMYYEGK